MAANHEQHTTRHPVADLLKPEMLARVCVATFKRHSIRGKRATVTAKIGARWACPLGVAVGQPGCPSPGQVALAIGGEDLLRNDESYDAIASFIDLVDNGKITPADVYILLGCDSADAARPPEAGTPGERP